MDRWALIHAYRHAAERDEVEPLSCPDCKIPYKVTIDTDDQPALWCWICAAKVRPGIRFYDQIKEVLNV